MYVEEINYIRQKLSKTYSCNVVICGVVLVFNNLSGGYNPVSPHRNKLQLNGKRQENVENEFVTFKIISFYLIKIFS